MVKDLWTIGTSGMDSLILTILSPFVPSVAKRRKRLAAVPIVQRFRRGNRDNGPRSS